MGTKSLKIGTSVTIQDTGQKGVISEITHGKYRVGKSWIIYSAGDLVADKVTRDKKQKQKINQISDKTMLLNSIYKTLAAKFKETHKECRAKCHEGCTGKATEIHHKYKRSGFWLIVGRLFLPVCNTCHRYITDNSLEAVEQGWSISRHKTLPYNFAPNELTLMQEAGINPPE